jgi:TRAP-type transport system periplasmic protein
MTLLKYLSLGALAIGLLLPGTTSAQVTLKLATLAPEGSIWMQALHDAKTEIETATAGAIKVKIYPGGIMGSEKDVLFKIKTGQLQGGGFMGYAIGKICPDSSALMFPMVFRNYEEVDQIMDKMRPFIDESARKNGYETLGWTEVGFSYAYGMKPIASLENVRATKVWGLDSPMLIELFAAGNVSSIPANVTDVLTALQTGSLETVFGPPTAAVAVQWHTKVRYYNTMRLAYSIGGVFLSSAGWATVPPQYRELVKAAFDKNCRLLTPKVRKSDVEALDYMRSQGVTPIAETPELLGAFNQIAEIALQKIKGSVFSVEAWNLLQQYLKEIRGP